MITSTNLDISIKEDTLTVSMLQLVVFIIKPFECSEKIVQEQLLDMTTQINIPVDFVCHQRNSF